MATPVPRVLVVRHGETPFNRKHLVRGWHDVPLTPKGEQEAKATAQRLKAEPIKRIWTSDLVRARDTAAAIATVTRAPVTVTRKLRPWHLGVWEGKPIKDSLKRRLELIGKDRDAAPQGGESFNEFAGRFVPFFRSILDKATADRATYALVCHTHNQRMALSYVVPPFGELTLKALIGEAEMPPGGVVIFEFRKGKWVVAHEDEKVTGENAWPDRTLADSAGIDPPPDDASTDELLTWWLSVQPLLLASLYQDAYLAGAQAFNEQFPERAAMLDALNMDDAFQAVALEDHATSIGKFYGDISAAIAARDPQAIDDFFDRNAYRVDMTGDSLAWAAEQHGYYAAGKDSGMMVDWQLGAVKTEHCADCLDNAAGGPYPPDQLPGVPGDGSTECGGSCNCSLEYLEADRAA